jgi:hypothetical protein
MGTANRHNRPNLPGCVARRRSTGDIRMAADTSSFTKLVPGFEFLQGLVKNAGAALPGIGQWVAPTLNPEELEKRIEELRTVQFWLEQNARMLGATIQALEVQRMTLSTLKTMNVQMDDLRESLKIRMPTGTAAAPAPEAPAPAPAASGRRGPAKAAPSAAAAPGAVDPMQWWGALTKQFTQLAATAMKDTATDAARNLATTMVKQSFDAASQTLKNAVEMPAKAAAKVADTAARTAGAARQAAGNAAAAARKGAAAAPAPQAAPAPAKRRPAARKRSGGLAGAPPAPGRSTNS